ncbi:SDR family oxidoreductase [Faunimonas pinastri]|uniref:SDR family oxidoreductase n=1 Tax=Faunimonas pinastri TaxID=1855383 RepID=UPI001EE9DA4D|nr:SDR family oxidoreductase [Faunimonas pinastri]
MINDGTSECATLDTIREDHLDQVFGLNAPLLVLAAQGAPDLMQSGGSIVLSSPTFVGTKGDRVCSVSKAAARSSARTWANERVVVWGIRVNGVSPGLTDTGMMGSTSDEVRAALTGLIPRGRLGRPEEPRFFLPTTRAAHHRRRTLRRRRPLRRCGRSPSGHAWSAA